MTPDCAGTDALAAAGTLVDVVGPSRAGWIDLFRNIALICIAPTLYLAGLLIERNNSTHNLIQRLTTPTLLDTYERLRLYRLSQEGQSKYNPYEPDKEGRCQHDLLFDLAIVLNFYEGICTEIVQAKWWQGGIRKRVIYETVASLIVGTQNILLMWYEELLPPADSSPYPNIRTVATESERWAKRKKVPIVDRIARPIERERTPNP